MEKLVDEFGVVYNPKTGKVSGWYDNARDYMRDLDVYPIFHKLRHRIIFGIAKLLNMSIGYRETSYKANIKGKYYSRINGDLYKNLGGNQ